MHARTDEPVAHHPQIEHAGWEREAAPREVALERRSIASRGVQRESRPPVGREILYHRARKVSGAAAHQNDDGGGCGQDTGGPQEIPAQRARARTPAVLAVERLRDASREIRWGLMHREVRRPLLHPTQPLELPTT